MKYSIVKSDFVHIAKNISTVYEIVNKNNIETIKLYNLYYIISTDEFSFNNSIHLPKRLIEKFNGVEVTNTLIKEMKNIGIINKKTVEQKLQEYCNCKDEYAYYAYKEKSMRLRGAVETIEINKYIEELNEIKKELLSKNENAKIIKLARN